jgi:hypothetical protein
MKNHPTNPHGVIVNCGHCGRELHVPRIEQEEFGNAPIACSSTCSKAIWDKRR